MKKLLLIFLAVIFISFTQIKAAQDEQIAITSNKFKIGIIIPFKIPECEMLVKGFKDEMKNLCYKSEDNLVYLEFNLNAEFEKIDAVTNELLEANPNVIVSISTIVTGAIIDSIPSSMPVVFSVPQQDEFRNFLEEFRAFCLTEEANELYKELAIA